VGGAWLSFVQEDMKDNPEAAQQWKNIMTDLMQD
jgi:hypothetical protein